MFVPFGADHVPLTTPNVSIPTNWPVCAVSTSTTGSALLGVALAALVAAAVGAAVASGVGRSRVQADITAAARSNERMSADLTRTKSPPELRM